VKGFSIKARWIFDGQRLQDGRMVRIEGGVIAEIASGGNADINIPNTLLMPGLVNAHAHLELSFLRGSLSPNSDFIGWLKAVKELRDGAEERCLADSAAEGATEAAHSATTLIVDHTATNVWQKNPPPPIRLVIAQELVNKSPPPFYNPPTRLVKFALAPHSPYRIPENSLLEALNLARQNRLLISIHAAEHPAEIRFLKDGSGPLRNLLSSFGVDLSNFHPPQKRPIAYLHSLGLLTSRTLLIHANYISDEEVELVRRSGAAVVYCPRSHQFFSHPPHPAPKLLAANIPLLFGTDSLASCPNFNLLEDLALAHRACRIAPETLLRCATSAAAAFIWDAPLLGHIRKGAPADLAAFKIPSTKNPLNALLSEIPQPFLVCCNGKIVHQTETQ